LPQIRNQLSHGNAGTREEHVYSVVENNRKFCLESFLLGIRFFFAAVEKMKICEDLTKLLS